MPWHHCAHVLIPCRFCVNVLVACVVVGVANACSHLPNRLVCVWISSCSLRRRLLLLVFLVSDDPRVCDEISALLAASASVNARNVSGRTALTVAAKRGNVGALRLLLQRGADCNDKTFGSGETPLHAAILARSPACVLELTAQPGIDVDWFVWTIYGP